MRRKVGVIGQDIGRSAEEDLIGAFDSAGWHTLTSPELDHTGKTDVRVTCPYGKTFDIQASVKPKSKKAQEMLERRGVVAISIQETKDKGVCPTTLACGRCAINNTCLS